MSLRKVVNYVRSFSRLFVVLQVITEQIPCTDRDGAPSCNVRVFLVIGQTVVKVFLRENPWDEPVDAHLGLRVQVVSNGGLPSGCRVFRSQTRNKVQVSAFDLFADD